MPDQINHYAWCYVTVAFLAYLTVYEPGVTPAYLDKLNMVFFLVLAASVGLALRLPGNSDFRVPAARRH